METYQVAFISELRSTHRSFRSVRITGRLSFLDATQRYCQLEDQGCVVLVDLSLVEMTSLNLNHLVQVFGCIEPHPSGSKVFAGCTDPYIVAAKIIREVDGLDLNLFRQATLYRREFLEQC